MFSREENLRVLLEHLLDEKSFYYDIPIPLELKEQQRLLRSLMNVRKPHPISDEVLTLQNEELQNQLQEIGVIYPESLEPVKAHPKIFLRQGNIIQMATDVIVTATNKEMLGCFAPLHDCIDNAVHSAAGIQLRQFCHDIICKQGHHEPIGRAQITPAFNLPAKYVIHTVGPFIDNGDPTPEEERQLASCYWSCLEKTQEYQLKSIALCCISTGEYRFPNELAAEIAIRTVLNFLEQYPKTCIEQIVFDLFMKEDVAIYDQFLNTPFEEAL